MGRRGKSTSRSKSVPVWTRLSHDEPSSLHTISLPRKQHMDIIQILLLTRTAYDYNRSWVYISSSATHDCTAVRHSHVCYDSCGRHVRAIQSPSSVHYPNLVNRSRRIHHLDSRSQTQTWIVIFRNNPCSDWHLPKHSNRAGMACEQCQWTNEALHSKRNADLHWQSWSRIGNSAISTQNESEVFSGSWFCIRLSVSLHKRGT